MTFSINIMELLNGLSSNKYITINDEKRVKKFISNFDKYENRIELLPDYNTNEMNYLSKCCDALPMGELYDKSGICSSCKKHAIFKAWDVGIKMKNTNKDEFMELTLDLMLMIIWDEADELCASFQTLECLIDQESLKAMESRAVFIRDRLHGLTSGDIEIVKESEEG
jgi:hypothetical protein